MIDEKKCILIKSGSKSKSINFYIIKICESLEKYNNIEVKATGKIIIYP
jgi:hypothetical protein